MNSQTLFKSHFQYPPTSSAKAHGRVNLIGEHTDYNNGFVLPTLIEQNIEVSISLRDDSKINGISSEFGENSADMESSTDGSWLDFVRGASYYIQNEGCTITGLDLAVTSSVPAGSGLSSSAAFEIALLRAICHLTNLDLKPSKIAKIGQLIEHQYIGTQCGIMDQMASACAEFGQALYLDCKNLSTETIPIFSDYTFIVIHSGSTRKLSKGKYNERIKETEIAAHDLNIDSLRYGDINKLNLIKNSLAMKRARHIITENERVKKAVDCLKRNDAQFFGDLMNQSHLSMDQDYEISSPELNQIVKTAQFYGAVGARLTGAGFGGCTVILTSNVEREFITEKILSNCPNSYLVTNITQKNLSN
jgi:galactokinase